MSFIKRLANVGKGVWHVNTGRRDPEESARIQALQRELEAAARPVLAHGPKGTRAAAAEAEDPQLRLDALANALREGRLTREEYDRACEKVIARLEGHEPEAARPEPSDRDQPPPADPPPGGPRKRTL